ncbi:MAG: SDR family oxidoreductase [Clostridium beijerinckii]|nr:SDR family oxidoreductase [Clostridium beijerinckii]MCI1584856.1 SDR family oxidoreductase [Clostridium beijerinckii]MCI1623953.1 SDR family oxidoreductase [Clostridium beijerinckii]
MRIFVTGATGFIGSKIVKELLDAGHNVIGLARSDASAASLTAIGATAHHGSLEDLDSLRSGASLSDGVIHAAFDHDNFITNFEACCETDRNAIEALGSALAGTNKPLVITFGTAGIKIGDVVTENDKASKSLTAGPRAASEALALSLVSKGVRVSVVRPAPIVYGDGEKYGLVTMLIEIARSKGFSAYVGDGFNRWPAVHRLDAAKLYRLALEKASSGSIFHAVANEGVPMREIAEAIGRRLSVPTKSISLEEATNHFGALGQLIAADIPASNALTQERLGWKPEHLGLIKDIDRA